jgi:hypothetical protein
MTDLTPSTYGANKVGPPNGDKSIGLAIGDGDRMVAIGDIPKLSPPPNPFPISYRGCGP